MHKRAFVYIIVFSFLLVSCGLNRHTAQEFYNKISGINDTLDKLTTDWHDLLDKAEVTKNYSTLAPVRTNLGAFISRSRSTVASMQRIPETEALLAREDALLETQSGTVADVYPVFEQFTEFTPKRAIDSNMARLNTDLTTEKSGVADVKKLLQVIAQKNDLKKK